MEPPSNFYQQLQKIYNKINHRGIDIINDYFPPSSENSDLYSERVKTILLGLCFFSVVMMVISPYGFLYACLPRPFYMFLLYGQNTPNLPLPPTPEWGMHYITILVYMLFAWLGIEYMELQGIKKPFHKIVYVLCLTELTFFVPFEYIYITLYDIFHNIPILGYPIYWLGDFYHTDLFYTLTHSVVLIDLVISFSTIFILYYIRKDLSDYYNLKPIKFDKISKILFSSFLLVMIFWILIPLFQSDVIGWGTQWFPQTIYVEYGYYADFGIDVSMYKWESPFGIVAEHWNPNDLIKITNHFSKLLSVMFMFYTFIPRVDNNG